MGNNRHEKNLQRRKNKKCYCLESRLQKSISTEIDILNIIFDYGGLDVNLLS